MLLLLLLTCTQGMWTQNERNTEGFLENFLSQIQEGGLTIDEQYLSENTDMPAEMKAALRDSLNNRSSFQLTKEKAAAFLSDFSSTIERYGFQVKDGGIKLRNNRFLNIDIKGPDFRNIRDRRNANGAADTSSASFPVNDINNDLYQSKPASNLDLRNPANNVREVLYDPMTGQYVFSNKIGEEELNVPVELDAKEYGNHALQNSLNRYWAGRSFAESEEKAGILDLGLDFSGSTNFFGKGAVNIRPQGYADLTFSVKTTQTDNPTLPENRRKNTYFDLDNKIQMNVLGSVGDKVQLNMNYNTEATFNFDNEFKLEFNGKEDDILKHFKAGNVSMASVGDMITVGSGSSYGGQSGGALPGYQKLWGFQNTQQYGKLTWSWVVSQQESETETMTLEGGATKQEFEITVDEYDANRHFFLTHFFKQNYDKWMAYLPNTNISGLNIDKIEVWVTNKRGNFDQARNLVAFMDLAEPNTEDIHNTALWGNGGGGKPGNEANLLYNEMKSTYARARNINEVSSTFAPLESSDFKNGEDYEKVENARLLTSSEYTVNRTLGYISLRSALNADEVLAVAFQYTYQGQVYQVGEFSSGSGITPPSALYLKLLKATNHSPTLPTWDLMMKNIYAINAYNLSEEDFTFSVVYTDDLVGTDLPYITEGKIKNKPLLGVMGLDQLNSSNERGSDGFFDWIEAYTIRQENGRIIFPVREPFGSHLAKKIDNDAVAAKYTFQELYDTTLVAARQLAEKNKFRMKGYFKSASGSEIKLNAFNIPRGSVKVMVGGRQLTENIDYTVDYNSGYLRILNQGILEAGQAIQVSMENQAMFSMQKKTLLGTNLVYRFSDDFQLGASITHLRERPTTTKVAVGSDPIANTVWGLTGGWHTELPFLTKAVDMLPFTDTKAPSSVTMRGEVAQLIAGHHKAIGENGSVYVDDFEATRIGINVMNYYAWGLSSVPKSLEKGMLSDSLAYGDDRAKLAWYSIDRILQEDRSQTPDHLRNDLDERSDHRVRSVDARELFPNDEQNIGESTYVPTLNLAYYPDEKGPYNYSVDLDSKGRLTNPEMRWAGITRKIDQPNFENSNIEYIEFWMMDPFIYDDSPEMGGEFFINLGDVSEDVLKDGRKAFENGLPPTELVQGVDSTIWGRIPTKQSLVNAFDNNENSRALQDIGIDGLNSVDEQSFFSHYVEKLEQLRPTIEAEYLPYFEQLISDPSQDDYHYFRGSDLDQNQTGILERYKHYNNYEGNSVLNSSESYSTTGKSTPDGEDINQDFTLSENDSYYEYRFKISPNDTAVGSNYIVDTRIEEIDELPNGESAKVKWYQYRIPVHDFQGKEGAISDFTSIRFMRMYMSGFKKPIVLRLANLELVRSEWRRYGRAIEPDIYSEVGGDIDVEAVNYEENNSRQPVNYVLPPGVTRQTDPSQQSIVQLNEQSMVMRVRNLAGRDSRAAYKVMQMDFRQYENLQMWIHAEALSPSNNDYTSIEDEDLALFVRLGSDYNDNYYEYELPLSLTPHGRYSDDEADRYVVWPEDNRLDIPLELLTALKLQRNSNNIAYNEAFTQIVTDKPGQKVSMKGNPSLSNVRMIMIGVRNLKSNFADKRSAEIWVNELRLQGLEESGGWMANGAMTVKIADIGSASASGMYSSVGWGHIEQTLMERQLEENRAFDVSTSLELGKLLPRKAKIQMPMYYAYSKATSAPKYDPLNQDLLLKDALDAADSGAEREAIKKSAQALETRRSINFSNVKVNISGKKKRFYDPVNLSLSYAFTERYAYNETVEEEWERTRNFGVNYDFSPSSKPIEPFKNIEAFKTDYLALIRDFNFYLKPQRLSFSSNLNRTYFEQQMRDLSYSNYKVPLQIRKDLYWDNAFSINYRFARSLSMDYSMKTYAIVDEITTDKYGNIVNEGDTAAVGLHKKLYSTAYDVWWNAMLDSLMTFGRVMDYNQTFNLRYTVPTDKIPMLDFIALDAAYSSVYGWERGSEAFWMYNDDENTDSTWVDNGHLIRNSQKGTINANLKMTTLYNKSKYLSDISKKYGRAGSTSRQQFKAVKYEDKNVNVKKGEALVIQHKLGSERATVRLTDANGKTIHGRKETKDENTIHFVPNEDVNDGRIVVSARVEDKNTVPEKVLGYTLNALMGLRNVSMNLVRDGSTVLPGFKPENSLFSGNTAPGWDFALGGQNRNIFTGRQSANYVQKYLNKDWLVTDDTFSEPYMITQSDQVNVRATIEPLAGLNIRLSSSYAHAENMTAFYSGTRGINTNLSRSGNYSHTWIGLATLFEKQDGEFYTSEAYENFVTFRTRIAERQTARIHAGISSTNQNKYENVSVDRNSAEVLIPAFLAAYSGKGLSDLDNIPLSTKPTWRSMLPNWQVTYAGLAKANFLKEHVSNLTLTHNYSSTYNIGNYTSLTDYDASMPPILTNTEGNSIYVSENDIAAVTVTEGLNPLLGVDLTLKNNISFAFAMNKLRSLSLNIASNQLIEARNNEWVMGAGYRFEDFKLFVRTATNKKGRAIDNDLRINADFSIRDVVSIIRRIDEENVQPSSGNKVTALKLTANYNINNNLEVTLFYDRQITNPVISTSFRTSNSNFGLTFRFSLAQ